MKEINIASVHLQAADAALTDALEALASFEEDVDAQTAVQVLEDAQRRVQKALEDVDDIEGAVDDLLASYEEEEGR